MTPQLVQIIDTEKQYPEDSFQATACLQHVYFLRKEWKTIIGSLQHDLVTQIASFGKRPSDTSGYTRVCVVKSRYFLGFAHEQEGSIEQARLIYDYAIQYTNSTQGDVAASSEYRLWTERLLSRACSLEMGDSDISTTSQASAALLRFRDWTRFWDRSAGSSVAASMSYDMPKRLVWGRYYRLLSRLLATGLVVTESKTSPISSRNMSTSDETLTSSRRKQRAELKRVEATCETLLLEETRFPKASQNNTEVELFAEQAVKNWRILNGSFWREADLGEGGKEAVTRGVLDILYRAATKTFHSTPILRQLFSIHAALAEFDLAIKAFDSYTEIIEKGKARAEKTGHHEVGLDSDNVVLFTAAEAIDVLCTYGSREQAEKALEVGKHVAKWLHQQPSKSAGIVDVTDGDETEAEDASTSAHALAAAYRAIGQSQANWARFTYEPRQRTEMQQLAIKSFREATNAVQGYADPDTAYLFAYVLAETRDTAGAVQVLKAALASISSEPSATPDRDVITTQRKSIPLWHLMALLLTAKGDYDTATRMCEAAYEQFEQIAKAMSQAGGHGESSTAEDDAGMDGLSPAFLGQLDESEKETLLQIKMTQLNLLALTESSSSAVNKGHELLALYAKLFGDPTLKPQQLQTSLSAMTLDTRKSTAGTLKSFRGSILGRPKSTHQSVDVPKYDTTPLPDNASVIARQRAATLGANADSSAFASPDHGPTSEKQHKHHLPHIPHPHLRHHAQQDNPTTTAADQEKRTHLSEKIGSNGSQPPQMPPKEDLNGTSHRQPGVLTVQDAPPQLDSTTRPDQPFPQIPHNSGNESQPAPIGHSDQPPTQDLRLPAPHPASSAISAPRFPSSQDRRHRVSLLVAVWLFVADLYMREALLDDAKGAIDEAEKLAQGFQTDLAQEESSARAFNERGWGAGSSVARLSADIWAEVSFSSSSANLTNIPSAATLTFS